MTQVKLPHHHRGKETEKMPDGNAFHTIAEIFKLLGDSSRVKIFWILCHGEQCVINLAAMMEMSSPAVSHHLRLLTQRGLTVSRREGKEVYYKASSSLQAQMLHTMIEQVEKLACPE